MARGTLPRMLTRAERRRPVRNAVVREILETAAALTTTEAKGAAFGRAYAALNDSDEDEREILLIRVMEALDLGRE